MRTILIATLLLAGVAQAKSHDGETRDGALTLSPAVVTMRGTYGQSTTQRVAMTNGTSQPFSCNVVVEDVIVRDGRRQFATAGATAGSIAATAVVSPRSLTIRPGEMAVVTVTLTIPPETSGRAVVVLLRGTTSMIRNGVPMLPSLGALMTFALSNDVALTTATMRVTPPTATATASVVQTCTNSGREPFVARGVMAILDSRGALVGKGVIEPKRLLPHETMELRSDYPGDLAPGHYRVMLTVGYEGQTLVRSADMDVR
ncbi:MAG TPA: hypothetical protein VGQ46_21320 [Thermoanaerobaculia bacterium]|jgi:hypothetical protein|nr:hypothetical protein [Thermoanaerobaculia bacterium]